MGKFSFCDTVRWRWSGSRRGGVTRDRAGRHDAGGIEGTWPRLVRENGEGGHNFS